MSDILNHAMRYLELGWSIIPLTPRGKKPNKNLISSWKEFQKRRPTREEVYKWFGEHKSNIGIVGGEISNLLIVDIDGQKGLNSIQKLKERGFAFPITPHVKTGKGYHMYFYIEDAVGNKVNLLPGIDIRCEGGYVVAPPSVHKNGSLYRWESFDVFDEDKFILQLAPKWLIEMINKPTNINIDSNDVVMENDEDDWVTMLLEKGVQEGARNDSATRLAGYFIGKGLNKLHVFSLLKAWNLKNNPPLPEKELHTIVDSIYQIDQKNKIMQDFRTKIEQDQNNIDDLVEENTLNNEEKKEIILESLRNVLQIPILHIQRVIGDDNYYIFTVLNHNDEEVKIKMTTKEVYAASKFREKIFDALGVLIPYIKKRSDWDEQLNKILSIADMFIVPMDETQQGAFIDYILNYVESFGDLDILTDDPEQQIFIKDNILWFKWSDFQAFTNTVLKIKLNRNAFLEFLRNSANNISENYHRKFNYARSDGSRTTKMCYGISLELLKSAL